MPAPMPLNPLVPLIKKTLNPDGQDPVDARRIAAHNAAMKKTGRPLSDEEKANMMTMLNSKKNFSTDEIADMAPNQ